VDEILAVCKRVPGVVPVLSFPHIHAREGGSLKRREDFRELFDKVKDALKLQAFYTHFSGVEHEGGNELRYTPIKKGDMRFEPLAEYLADESADITIISDSPLLEHDAMYMKVILERVQLKNEAKVTREEVKVTAPIRPPGKPIAPPKKGKAPAKPLKKGEKAPARKPARSAPRKAAKGMARKPAGKAPPKRPAPKKPAKKAPTNKAAKKAPPRKPAPKKPVKKAPTKKPAKMPGGKQKKKK